MIIRGNKMKIVVCVKQVPSSTKVSLDPNTHNLKSNGTIGIMNPMIRMQLKWL